LTQIDSWRDMADSLIPSVRINIRRTTVEQNNLESLLWLVAIALLALICYGMYLLNT
jgi:hypothetical protein